MTGCLTTERVSVAEDGTQGNGPSAPTSISGDGRYLTFTSTATNLVDDDANGAVSDLYLRDNVTRTVTKAAIEADGTPLDTESSTGQISDDGRYVTFDTLEPATADDTDTNRDVFRHDRETGETILVSTPPPDATGVGWSGDASANGQFVAVRGSSAIFVRDLTTGTSTLVANAEVALAEVSDDGQTVVFTTRTPLLPGDTPSFSWDVHVFDVGTGALERLTPPAWSSNGEPRVWVRDLALSLDISPDARFIAYTSLSGGVSSANLHDRTTGITETLPDKPRPDQQSWWTQFEGGPTVSDDGRYVAYARTQWSELDRPPSELVVHDREQDTSTVTAVLSYNTSARVLLSGDGRWTTFAQPTTASFGDPDGIADVFLTYAHDPQISVEAPHEVGPGTHELVFDAGELVGTPAVSVDGGGVTVDAVSVSGTELRVTVTVSPSAAPGARNVFVYNDGSWPGRFVVGATNLCGDCVTITT